MTSHGISILRVISFKVEMKSIKSNLFEQYRCIIFKIHENDVENIHIIY